jgi:hypothetical protein
MANASNGLRGFIAQSMDGRKASTRIFQEPFVYGFGTWTWTCPRTGYWKFASHGPGAFGNSGVGAASGAYAEKTVRLVKGQQVALIVGREGTDTTVTFPPGTFNGAAMTAGSASGVTAGAASGGDLMYPGSPSNGGGPGVAGQGPGGGVAGSGVEVGAGAPGTLQYPGGRGGDQGATVYAATGATPGAGGGWATNNQAGGDGRTVIAWIKP